MRGPLLKRKKIEDLTDVIVIDEINGVDRNPGYLTDFRSRSDDSSNRLRDRATRAHTHKTRVYTCMHTDPTFASLDYYPTTARANAI